MYHVSVCYATDTYLLARWSERGEMGAHLSTPFAPDADMLRARILAQLRDYGPSSISSLANRLMYPTANVRDKLLIAKRHGHVRVETKPMIYASGQRVMVHQYTITEEGKKWLQLAEQS